MCSLEDAFNSFVTDEKHKEMLNKYELQDKKLKEEYQLNKIALFTKYKIEFEKLVYSQSDYIKCVDKNLFISVFKDKTTNQKYYKYINNDTDSDIIDDSNPNVYIWLNEEEYTKLKEEEAIKLVNKLEQIENNRPELKQWITENPGKIKGQKLEIYENSDSEPKYVTITFNNNDIWYDGDFKYIRFKNNPSKEAIRMALLEEPIASIIGEEDEEIDMYYSETPQYVLDKYL